MAKTQCSCYEHVAAVLPVPGLPDIVDAYAHEVDSVMAYERFSYKSGVWYHKAGNRAVNSSGSCRQRPGSDPELVSRIGIYGVSPSLSITIDISCMVPNGADIEYTRTVDTRERWNHSTDSMRDIFAPDNIRALIGPLASVAAYEHLCGLAAHMYADFDMEWKAHEQLRALAKKYARCTDE